MDERSGRSSGAAGMEAGATGTMTGNSGIMTGSVRNIERNSGTLTGGRADSGVESRNTGGVSRKTPRGFAAMDPQAQRAIAAKGGRAAHQKGTAHEFTSEEARIAGRKGGEASRGGRRSTATTESTA
ncbi:MAG TPA: KGG domain-containing protein [Gemmatimonadaceae bacterium]